MPIMAFTDFFNQSECHQIQHVAKFATTVAFFVFPFWPAV